jgi:membrane protein YqaA with SNARE-associated domain
MKRYIAYGLVIIAVALVGIGLCTLAGSLVLGLLIWFIFDQLLGE